jgi:hypothetical protein
MKVHLGSLLCGGLLILATSSGALAEDKTKKAQPGQTTTGNPNTGQPAAVRTRRLAVVFGRNAPRAFSPTGPKKTKAAK